MKFRTKDLTPENKKLLQNWLYNCPTDILSKVQKEIASCSMPVYVSFLNKQLSETFKRGDLKPEKRSIHKHRVVARYAALLYLNRMDNNPSFKGKATKKSIMKRIRNSETPVEADVRITMANKNNRQMPTTAVSEQLSAAPSFFSADDRHRLVDFDITSEDTSVSDTNGPLVEQICPNLLSSITQGTRCKQFVSDIC